MSKQEGQVFTSAVRASLVGGGVEKYRCAEDVQDLLGAAMTIWFEGSIDLVQNGAGGAIKITFKAYHTCIPDALAGDVDAILTVVSWGQAGDVTPLVDPLIPQEFAGGVHRWVWEPGHIDRTIRLPSGAVLDFNTVESIYRGGLPVRPNSFGTERLWLLDTMDIRSPYKRHYMAWIAMAGTTDPMAVLYFLDSFLGELTAEIGSLHAFGNLDLHWYHFLLGDDAARPGACIVQDIREARKTLNRRGSSATVSLCEIGIPGFYGMVLGYFEFDGYPMVAGRPPPQADGDSFQAREVWRRVAVGLASGAKRIGWHTHRAFVGLGGQAGCGLRDDSAVTIPRNEGQRRAWAAFERIYERLLASTGTSGSARLAWPTHAAFGIDFSQLDPMKPEEMTLVVEFYTPDGNWYYLAMIDGVAKHSAAAPTSTLTLAPVGWKKGTLFKLTFWSTLPPATASPPTGSYVHPRPAPFWAKIAQISIDPRATNPYVTASRARNSSRQACGVSTSSLSIWARRTASSK